MKHPLVTAQRVNVGALALVFVLTGVGCGPPVPVCPLNKKNIQETCKGDRDFYSARVGCNHTHNCVLVKLTGPSDGCGNPPLVSLNERKGEVAGRVAALFRRSPKELLADNDKRLECVKKCEIAGDDKCLAAKPKVYKPTCIGHVCYKRYSHFYTIRQ